MTDVATADSAVRIDHVSCALIAGLACGGLGLAAGGGGVSLLVGVAVVQAALIASWVFGTALPGRIGALLLGAGAAGAADAVITVWPDDHLGSLLPVVGLAIPLLFVHQLTRGVVRVRVVESLSDISLLLVCVVALSTIVQLRHELDGNRSAPAVAYIIGAALVAGHFADLLFPAPRFDPQVRRGLFAVLVSAGVGAVIGHLRLADSLAFPGNRPLFVGAAVGLLAALFGVAAGFVQHASSLPATGRAIRLRAVFGALVPVALALPVAYLLCLAIHS